MNRLVVFIVVCAFLEASVATLFVPAMGGDPSIPYPWGAAHRTPVQSWEPLWRFQSDGLVHWVPEPDVRSAWDAREVRDGYVRVVVPGRIHWLAWIVQLGVVLGLNVLAALALRTWWRRDAAG